MGRAIVREPQGLPDGRAAVEPGRASLRVQMRAEVARVQRELGVTTIYVTHDQVEAMTMGDRVAVMRERRAAADRRRRRCSSTGPSTSSSASFIGSPADEPRRGEAGGERRRPLVVQVGGAGAVRSRPRWPRAARAAGLPLGARSGSESGPSTCVRRTATAGVRLRGAVRRRPRRSAPSSSSTSRSTAEPVLTEEGSEVAGDVDAAALQRLESEANGAPDGADRAARERNVRPAVDAAIEVAVDTRRLHFFDLDNGIAIYDLT